jgi:hypothetical protein
MNLANMAAYNCALFIWLGYALAKSHARNAGSILLRPQRWEQGLSDLHHSLPADSLIPMFEGMVDRALSRNHPVSSVTPESVGSATHARAVPMDGLGVSGLPSGVATKK